LGIAQIWYSVSLTKEVKEATDFSVKKRKMMINKEEISFNLTTL
jgi:hypothetical protein